MKLRTLGVLLLIAALIGGSVGVVAADAENNAGGQTSVIESEETIEVDSIADEVSKEGTCTCAQECYQNHKPR